MTTVCAVMILQFELNLFNPFLPQMLEDVDAKFEKEKTVEHCEYSIRRLRRKVAFKTKTRSALVNNVKVYLDGEKGEYFPTVVTNEV